MKRNICLFHLLTLILAVSLCVGILVHPIAAMADDNLLKNGGFEKVNSKGEADGWFENAYHDEVGYSQLSITTEKAHSGQYSALVENASSNDARFICTVSVKPNTTYKLSGYVFVENMEPGGNGANLAIEDLYAFSDCLFDTNGQWQYIEWYGKTGVNQKTVTLGVRVGGYGSESIGKAYFDDISLEKVKEVPQGYTASSWYVYKDTSAKTTEQNPTMGQHHIHVLFCILCGLLFAVLCQGFIRHWRWIQKQNHTYFLLFTITLAVIARIAMGGLMDGYPVDIGCFQAWSLRMADKTPLGFYSPDYFCDYPPGYMLLLWPVGLALRAVMPFGNHALNLLVLKSVPLICDMVTAMALYTHGKKYAKPSIAVTVAALYAFNPSVLINGAVWGQVDSVLAMLLIFCAIYAMEERWSVALPIYMVSILVKPQALLFAPIAGIWLLMSLFGMTGKSFQTQWKGLVKGIAFGLIAALAIVIPFSIRQESFFGWLFNLYSETLSSYAYATVNTANLHYLLAMNWQPISKAMPPLLPLFTALLLAGGATLLFLYRVKKANQPLFTSKDGHLVLMLAVFAVINTVFTVIAFVQEPFAENLLTYGAYGYIMMAFAFAVPIVCMFHSNDAKQLPFYLALGILGVYLLGVKIHERYLFAAIPLLLLAFLRTGDLRLVWLMAIISCTTLINAGIVLDNALLFGSEHGHLNDDSLFVNIILCILNLYALGYGYWISYSGLSDNLTAKRSAKHTETLESPMETTPPSYERMLLSPEDHSLHLNWKDWLIMGVVTIAYAVVAFVNLGSTVAPQHGFVSSSAEETITFKLEEKTEFSTLYYAGVSNYGFSIAVSDDGVNWSENYPCEMREGLCYRWNYALQSKISEDGKINYGYNRPEGVLWLNGQYLRLNAERGGLNLFEIVTRDRNGNNLNMAVVDHQGANPAILDNETKPEYLLDEQNTCIGEPGWFTGTYFDEIYHGRTAYEHLHGQRPYETTHPPLGKLLMAAGIAIFGMTPFGWRFAGALIGVLMLPALYLLAKQLFKRRDLAGFSMAAFSLDLMHFTQTRIATIDSFPVFFILLSYWFMVRYMHTDVFAVEENERPSLFTKAYWKSLIPLAFSGLMMGLSIASKWIGIYSAVGLAVLYFTAIYRQYRAGNVAFGYATDGSDSSLSPNQVKRIKGAQDHALNRAFVTCGFCIIFFILVPCIVYYLSYIPYLAPTGKVTLQRVIQAQIGMLDYHGTPGLGMDHPFQSPWWQWPFILKPMWFAQDNFEPAGLASTIMCMGNPWIFYLGAVCMLATLIALFARQLQLKDKRLQLRHGDGNMTVYILAVGFLSQYLPWVLVPRSMYMYHYFASVPFIILATAWVLSLLARNNQKQMRLLIGIYLVIALGFFVLYYPYASGMLTSTKWLDAGKWLPQLLFGGKFGHLYY
ncbi:MAG: phospholipid carrier-dependent glycosyltransferase [Clostridiales bacterium]|nr:phospholipid carrier-dependent glycosyltransferase [Clostridiales bacterium]